MQSFILNDWLYNIAWSQQLTAFHSSWQAIYLLAASTLGVEPSRYLTIIVPRWQIRLNNKMPYSSKVPGQVWYSRCISWRLNFLAREKNWTDVFEYSANNPFFTFPYLYTSCVLRYNFSACQSLFNFIHWYLIFEYEMSLFIFYRCVVVEDSAIGLTAAKAAGMKCIITKSR